jgi:hypothetical protein
MIMINVAGMPLKSRVCLKCALNCYELKIYKKELYMSDVTLAMIAIGVASNLTCFLFGMIAGRNSAYKTVGPVATADTVQDISSVPRGNVN